MSMSYGFRRQCVCGQLDMVWDESGKLVSDAFRGYDDTASPTLEAGPHSELHNISGYQLFRLWESSEASICWATARLTKKDKRCAIDEIEMSVRKSKAQACHQLRGKRSRTQGHPPARYWECLCTRQIINRAEYQASTSQFDQEKPLISDGFRLIPKAPFVWGSVMHSAAQEAAPNELDDTILAALCEPHNVRIQPLEQRCVGEAVRRAVKVASYLGR